MMIWLFIPEIRRLINWRTGFASVSIISVVPLLSLLPFAFGLVFWRHLRKVDQATAICAWLWFGGFTFSLAVAFAQGNLLSGIYSYAEFMLPAAFALWLAAIRIPQAELYNRIASFMLAMGTIIALYGAIQFVVAPPWDMAWLQAAGLITIGKPHAFEFRPFSTLNGPGLFADFLTVAILLNLPRLQAANALRLLQVGLLLGVLILTMVRSDWIACAIGLVAYTVLSPKPFRNLTVFAAVALVCVVLVANASTILGGDAGVSIASRFSTFTDLNSDTSFNERSRYFGTVLSDAAHQPLGVGVGVLGTAAKLGASGNTADFDNGYVARFTEMGYFGFACYLATLSGAFAIAVRRWFALRNEGDGQLRGAAAACIAVQAALLFLDISSDHHNALPGILFWISVAVLPRTLNDQASMAHKPSTNSHSKVNSSRGFAS